MTNHNRNLNRQRKQIVQSGRKDAGYHAKHRKGCGFVILITGFTLMSISGSIFYFFT